MKLLYIGGGYVGICSAAVAADSGHDVLIYDIDEKRIEAYKSGEREKINEILFEDGLVDLLAKNQERLSYSSDFSVVRKYLDTAEAIFLCLPTPEKAESGETNLNYYYSAIETLLPALKERNTGTQSQYMVLINKSTVPIDTADFLRDKLVQSGVVNVGIAANPEFLAEGKAIQGSLKPDRIVVGAWQEKDFIVMRSIYQRFYQSPTVKYVEVNPREAAAGKLLANFYLFNKLAVCYDAAGRVSEAYPCIQFENLRNIIGTDERIGTWGLFDSLYAGGSCFIKDSRSLSYQLREKGQRTDLIDEVHKSNEYQLERFLNRLENEGEKNWNGLKVAVLGLSYKRDTNDIRNSPSLKIVTHLMSNNVGNIKLYDPMAIDNFKKVFPANEKITYCENEDSALKEVDCIIMATDWPQFRSLGDKILILSNRPLIMDGRRILQHKYEELKTAGFDIIAVGSPFIKGNK